jgi:hypothetical protein
VRQRANGDAALTGRDSQLGDDQINRLVPGIHRHALDELTRISGTGGDIANER